MWIFGELFTISPGAQFVQRFQEQIFDSISSWSGAIGTVVGIACVALKGTDPVDDICRVLALPGNVVEIYNQLDAMGNTAYWGFDEADLCGAVVAQWEEENAADEDDEEDDDDENGSPSWPDAPPEDDEPAGDGE